MRLSRSCALLGLLASTVISCGGRTGLESTDELLDAAAPGEVTTDGSLRDARPPDGARDSGTPVPSLCDDDPSRWRFTSLPRPGADRPGRRRIAGLDGRTVVIAGRGSNSAFRFDGMRWSPDDLGLVSGGPYLPSDVTSDDRDIYIATLNDDILRSHEGGPWQVMTARTGAPVQRPSVRPGETIFIVGLGGRSTSLDDAGAWSEVETLSSWDFNAVDHDTIVGAEGTVFRLRDRWREVSTPSPATVNGVWTDDDGSALAVVGESGSTSWIWRVTDEGVEEIFRTSGVTRALLAVFGTGARDVWAVGENGLVVHFDGVEWRELELPTDEGLVDVWAPSRDEVFAVTESGVWHCR